GDALHALLHRAGGDALVLPAVVAHHGAAVLEPLLAHLCVADEAHLRAAGHGVGGAVGDQCKRSAAMRAEALLMRSHSKSLPPSMDFGARLVALRCLPRAPVAQTPAILPQMRIPCALPHASKWKPSP